MVQLSAPNSSLVQVLQGSVRQEMQPVSQQYVRVVDGERERGRKEGGEGKGGRKEGGRKEGRGEGRRGEGKERGDICLCPMEIAHIN